MWPTPLPADKSSPIGCALKQMQSAVEKDCIIAHVKVFMCPQAGPGVMADEPQEQVVVEGLESLKELEGYLRHPKREVREMGAQVAWSLTGTEAGRRGLVSSDLLPTLCRLTADDAKVAEHVVSALTNICADGLPAVLDEVLKRGIVDRLMETVATEGCTFRDRALMLLANVTSSEAGARRMLQLREIEGKESEGNDGSHPSLVGLHVRRLLRWFVTQYDSKAEEDEWQHVASIVCNISQLQEGRDLLRRKETALIQTALLPQLTSRNPVRRLGCASALRNCCFELDDHDWLIHEVNIVPYLLYPLMGPDLFDDEDKAGMDPLVYRDGLDKVREPDAAVRKSILETLLVFCSTRESREELRKRKVYPVVREADLCEDSEELNYVAYQIVNFLNRDEGEVKEGLNVQHQADASVLSRQPGRVETKEELDAMD